MLLGVPNYGCAQDAQDAQGCRRGLILWYEQGTLQFALLTKYCLGDQIKNNEIGKACDMYGEQERCIRGFGGVT